MIRVGWDWRKVRRLIHHLGWKALLFVQASLAACKGVAEDEPRPTEPAAPLAPAAALRLADAPVVSIGGDDDRKEYSFGALIGAVRLSDGQLVIGDWLYGGLRVYDANGQYIRSIGGRGEGPGEFERLWSMARIRGDTVVTWDRHLRRLTYFPPDGKSHRISSVSNLSEILLQAQAAIPPVFVVSAAEILPAGRGLIVRPLIYRDVDLVPMAPTLIQDTLPIFLTDHDGKLLAELGPFPGDLFYYYQRTGRAIPSFFGERMRYAAGDSVVYAASTRDNAVKRYSAVSGEPMGSIHLPVRARPLEEEHVEWIRERMESVDPGSFGPMPLPELTPVLGDLRVASDGRLWVQVFHAPNDPMEEWLIYDSLGHLAATVRMEDRFSLIDAGEDYVLVVETDELDRETVHQYQLIAE